MKPSDHLNRWAPFVSLFVPYYSKGDHIESPEYDKPAFREVVGRWFEPFGLEWEWVPVTLAGLGPIIERTVERHRSGPGVVLNLCDGNELDGSPGVTVVRALEAAGLAFSGADSHFYDITTYKVPMKARLLACGVPTSPYVPLRTLPDDVARVAEVVGYPAFVKPEVSAGSGGIGLKSRALDASEVLARVEALLASEDGPFYRSSGIYAERFIDGPEFTVLVVANRAYPHGVHAYPACERLFHSALPSHERFLSYDRYWSEFKEEPRLPGTEPFYHYGLAPDRLQPRLLDLAVRAFLALGGTGYGRVDMRLHEATGELFVLEANANCGMSGDKSGDNETSIGEMLYLTGIAFDDLLAEILMDAHDRRNGGRPAPARP